MSARIIGLTAYRAQRERADARYAQGYEAGYDAGMQDGHRLGMGEAMLSFYLGAFVGCATLGMLWLTVFLVRR